MPTPTTQTDLAGAFKALRTYDAGSGRGALLPIDQAAQACLKDPAARQDLEQQLLHVLESGSAAAREYVCSKLAIMGSGACANRLASLLADAQLGSAARNALQLIPGPEAAQALRGSLDRLEGAARLGVIQSLGIRRDSASVRPLTRLLQGADPETSAAAAGALGNIGSVKAGRVLRALISRSSRGVPRRIADAALACAERLLAEGGKSQALALYQAVAGGSPPAHIRDAARRGLAAAGSK